MNTAYKFALAVLMSLPVCATSLSAPELPGDSIYHLESLWTNQDGQEKPLKELGGQLQISAFIYTYCEHTCPRIIAKLKTIEDQLPAAVKARSHISLFSLDPDRDTIDILKSYAQEHGLDASQWSLYHGDKDAVLELAAVLGTRYRPMGVDDIAHSNTITVLDYQGVVRYQLKGINDSIDELLATVATASSPE